MRRWFESTCRWLGPKSWGRWPLAFALGLMSATIANGDENWWQFRGPGGQGMSNSKDVPITWSDTENVDWKTTLPGKGWSSPVVRDGQIWMTAALENGISLHALCVDFETGRLVHDVEVFRVDRPVEIHPKNSYASPTPVLEPGRVYVHFGTMGTACLATDTAKILWTNRDLKLDHQNGPGSSPVLYHELLIVNCDGRDVQYVVALDKLTGKIVWKTNRTGTPDPALDRRKAYCTPLVIKVHGHEELISPGANQVVAYVPGNGHEIWKVTYNGYSNVPRPVFGHSLLFIGTGYDKASLYAIRPEGQGDLTATNVAWKMTNQAPLNPSPLLWKDDLYVVSDAGMLTCVDAATGKEHWKHRLGSEFSASPVWAEEHIYFCGESGVTTVIQAGPEYKELAVNHLDGRIMASPAIVGRSLIIRTDTTLYRFEKK
jgi:outer membrane protein assembly factor BamB